ncbi:tetratricopeptide repeat protein [Rhabdothermincola salaria]|uniref:tetratricopeptide repeat protein n=1 Tax=Rhabdothermincola salaria TaxID=2903142 RepID=UPI001E520640|nr:tetratricopeptide repeat protein [Rhabdothermincola salaria]
MTVIDVTDATFQTEVLDRSQTTPVVVDLWAPWCGPCKTLGPLLESVVGATEGRVVLAKVNVDDNPATSQAFRVQSIPAVYAVSGGQVVDGFVGAQGPDEVQAFVDKLGGGGEPSEIDLLREAGDEASLRQALELEPDNPDVIADLAELLVGDERRDEALELLARVPETPAIRRVAALARSGGDFASEAEVEAKLVELLDRVKDDDAARQEYVDLLELLGPDDPRTATYRKKLTTRLF